jgi:hypothetical protein
MSGTLFIVAEQGIGDSISYARFVPATRVRAKRVIFAVQPELVRLLSRVLPGIEVVPYPKTFPAADAWCAVCSLPHILGLTDLEFENAPALPVPRLSPPAGWKSPGDRFRIGICWGGSKQNDIDKWRSLPGPEPFLGLYEVPGIELYSFQIGERAPELHTSGAAGLIRDLTPWIRDVADSAAILQEMDLVITVETFLGHLAGFMDVPCWVLDSYNGGDYRTGRDGRKPIWYGKHRIFRQGPAAMWEPVWRDVKRALYQRVQEHNDERNN